MTQRHPGSTRQTRSDRLEPTVCTCEGYRPYSSVVIPLHANGCPLTKGFLPGQAARVKHKSDPGEGYTFVDVERRKYRCLFCAGAYRLLRSDEENLKQQWTKAHPNENFPFRIRSLDDLKRAQRKLTDQSTFHSEKPKRVRGKDLPHVIHPAVPERTRKWRREKSLLPFGLCGLCGTLTCEYHKNRPRKFHRECVQEYQREHGAELAGPRNADGTFNAKTNRPIEVRPRRGQPVTAESLQRHFKWTERHKLQGDSLGDIAGVDVGRNAVVEGIEFIMGKVAKDGSVEKKSVLPRPELMPLPIRQRITALRALADPRCLI